MCIQSSTTSKATVLRRREFRSLWKIVTDLINGLVDLLSLETQAVWYAAQEGFDPIEPWDEE
jgi:hypothetical protein